MVCETKTKDEIKQSIVKSGQKSNNKIIFWILGGCLVLLVIGGLVVAGFAWWGYSKIRKEIKTQQFGRVQLPEQAIDRQNAMPTSENTNENIPEDPAVQPPTDNLASSSEGTTPYVAEKQIGYIKNVYTKSGKNYLDIDYVQWLTGDAAEKAMREDGRCPKTGECIVYDDYYIRNQNPLIRTLEIAPEVKIVMQTYDAERTGNVMNNQEISLDQFKGIFSSKEWSHLKDAPYIVEISNQQIIKITEQYIP
jgi:hypothetical protein